MELLIRARRRALLLAGAAVGILVCSLSYVAAVTVAADSLPARLTDQEFWGIVSTMSEPNGFFRSDNLLSNELGYQRVIPELLRNTKPGQVYLGVGPEQNFTYIAATKPAMVFIIDIRRGNLDLHLMYKAIFELSADRADFVSRLFARKRPDGLTSSSTAQEIFAAFEHVDPTDDLYNQNLKAIHDDLTQKHGFDLSTLDLAGIDYVYKAFRMYGPGLQYNSTG